MEVVAVGAGRGSKSRKDPSFPQRFQFSGGRGTEPANGDYRNSRKPSIMKKALYLLLLLLATASLGHARNVNLDLGLPASATPYDPYMSPVKQVLTQLGREDNSLDRVRQLMHEGRSFR